MNDQNLDNLSSLLLSFYEENNTEAINSFFSINKNFAFRASYYLIKDIGLAESAVKQAFFSIYKKAFICPASAISDNDKIKAWLLNIVLITAREVYKRDKHTIKIQIRQKTLSHKDNLKQILILKATLDLPEKLKLPLMLYYKENVSYLDISEIYSAPQSTIKEDILMALEELKESLKNSGILLTGDLICREIKVIKIPEPTEEFLNQVSVEYLSTLKLPLTTIPSINQPSLQWLIMLVVALILVAGLFYLVDELYTKFNKTSIEQNNPEKKILASIDLINKKSWDFSLENCHGLFVIKGTWTYNPIRGFMKPTFNETTLVKTPFEFNNNSKPMIIYMNSFIFNPFADREISSRLSGYLTYSGKTVKYKFTNHIPQLNKNKKLYLNGYAIDFAVKMIVHQKGIFIFNSENQLINSMVFLEPIPLSCRLVIGFDNIYLKKLNHENTEILSPEIESIINKSITDATVVTPTGSHTNEKPK